MNQRNSHIFKENESLDGKSTEKNMRVSKNTNSCEFLSASPKSNWKSHVQYCHISKIAYDIRQCP